MAAVRCLSWDGQAHASAGFVAPSLGFSPSPSPCFTQAPLWGSGHCDGGIESRRQSASPCCRSARAKPRSRCCVAPLYALRATTPPSAVLGLVEPLIGALTNQKKSRVFDPQVPRHNSASQRSGIELRRGKEVFKRDFVFCDWATAPGPAKQSKCFEGRDRYSSPRRNCGRGKFPVQGRPGG